MTLGELAPIDSIRKGMNHARPMQPGEERCFMNLVRVNCWRSAERTWGNLCRAALEQAGRSAVSRLELLTRLGISQWVSADRSALP